jgi:hypothetical protein
MDAHAQQLIHMEVIERGLRETLAPGFLSRKIEAGRELLLISEQYKHLGLRSG